MRSGFGIRCVACDHRIKDCRCKRQNPTRGLLSIIPDLTSFGVARLWFLEIVVLAFVCLGILILLVGSDAKLVALAAIVFSG
jgi:hypothetical protein